MKPWEILQGEVRKVLKTLPSNHFDAVLGDPPYAYKFMGKRWDYTLPSVNVWTELLRVMKPGAHACLFGGPRTFHRLACAIEDAGLLPLDVLMYLHGKGFPKSLDIAKAIDKEVGIWRGRAGEVKSENGAMGGPNFERTEKGEAATDVRRRWQGWHTALKPAYEPVLLVMKALEGTFAENVQKWGTGALAIDACRIGQEERHNPSASKVGMWSSISGDEQNGRPPVGRWPANVALDEEAAQMLDEQSGNRPGMSGGGRHKKDYPGGMFGGIDSEGTARGDSGGASRFFYTTKVNRVEREAGCEEIPKGTKGADALRDGERSAGGVRNNHPTLKSIELTRWLATLLLPPKRETPRMILVPYSGAGSEMIGCIQAGWDVVVGIEREAEYVEIAKARITKGGVFSGLLDKRMKRERERDRKVESVTDDSQKMGPWSPRFRV